MKKIILPIIATSILTACESSNENNKMIYPETQKEEVVDIYFNTEIADPYRWLEDDMSKETALWVQEQNNLTFGYLSQIPYRDALKNRLEKLWNYEKITAPFKEGDYFYFYKNDGLQNQSVLYRYKSEGDEPELFLDPNTFSEEGTTSLGGLNFSKSGKLLAYSISEAGSDWRKVILMEAETKKILEDTLVDIKFSGMSWFGDEGIYYSSYEKPKGSELSSKTDQHRLFYHKLGTSQKDDKIIFGKDVKRRYVSGYVSRDNNFLFISAANSTSGNELYYIDLREKNLSLKTLVENYNNDHYVMMNDDNYFYIVTNLDAPNKKIVRAEIKKPAIENWIDLIPETENVLSPSKGAGYIFANYMVNAISQVKQYDKEGNLIREIELPGIGTVSGFGGKEKDSVLYYSFTNYITANNIYSYNPKTGDSEIYNEAKIDYDASAYESQQIIYTSKDGTEIPMIISHKKGLKLNGKNPTILYGYGGFNVSLTPSFNVANLVWMEQGGIYAVANLRGGGEYGKKWHNAGTKMQKQNVFDDFISAAEYLINNNYTSSDYLAVRGGSNGGLLVGATMTQRPDLMKVALPAVGVLDMLRYHTFTAGAGWAYDYGTAEDSKEMFEYLLNYSPVHNVKEGVSYPATLVTTGDHDDRVVPAHSFKFAAHLQDKQSGINPTLIRIEVNAGHGAGKPLSKTIEEYADIFGFTLYNMGFRDLPNKNIN